MFMYLCIHPVYMHKLYWRLKINGVWTFRPAAVDEICDEFYLVVRIGGPHDESGLLKEMKE